jgi:hypothetical protein
MAATSAFSKRKVVEGDNSLTTSSACDLSNIHTPPRSLTRAYLKTVQCTGKLDYTSGGIVTHITREGAHASAWLRRVRYLTGHGATDQSSLSRSWSAR